MQITLRRNAVLKTHKVAEPITIQCVVGTGELVDIIKNEIYKLSQGVLITIEPEVIHEVRALLEVSILLTKFKNDNDLRVT
jgi:quercetin dioxygenase-like cupin family protein